MRTLTIKRNKVFTSFLAKDKVYIEDPINHDLFINGVPCRKIGTIKNGEEKTFDIDPIEAKVFVVADKLSRNICNDFYKLPAGDESITLTGEHKYNPFNGNAFRFEGVTDEEVLANRKRTSRKSAVFYAIIFICVFIASFALSFFAEMSAVPEDFTYSDMTVTLTSDFSEICVEGFSACYESYYSFIMINKDDKEYFEDFDAYTLEQYGKDTIAVFVLFGLILKIGKSVFLFYLSVLQLGTGDSIFAILL